jgi:hypothetical protein
MIDLSRRNVTWDIEPFSDEHEPEKNNPALAYNVNARADERLLS